MAMTVAPAFRAISQASIISFDEPECEGVIKHGTYYYAGKLGIDECCIWGDYFYMEALMRKLRPDWKKYW